MTRTTGARFELAGCSGLTRARDAGRVQTFTTEGEEMKTASELVAILEGEALNFARSTTAQTKIGIAVRLREDETGRIVWSDGKNGQAILDSLMENGGEPIGLIRVSDAIATGGGITVTSALFGECVPDRAAQMALNKICRSWALFCRDQLAQSGSAKIIAHTDMCSWNYSAHLFLQ
jgi:hypothetical protein